MSTTRSRTGRVGAAIAGGVAMALFIANPAMADTSQATASALEISLIGLPAVSSGTFTASNDGITESFTGNNNPSLAVLGAQTVITAGALPQDARAFTDGTSAACAGVLGAGGTVTIGPTGTCTSTTAPPVILTLGVIGLATITLEADAIFESCIADSDPSGASALASLVNARIVSTVLGIPTTLLALPANPAPNTGLNIPGVLSLVLNAQTAGPGSIEGHALTLTALAGTLVSLDIGQVTCGPNAIAPPIPVIPLDGAPIAAAVLVLGTAIGGTVWFRRRRLARI
jgi:hypothetical protein